MNNMRSIALMGTALGAATSLAALPQTALAQTSGSPDGFVESKRGGSSQTVIVRNGRTITAKANTPLYAGDKIRVSGRNSSVTVRFTGRKGRFNIGSSNSPQTIPKAEAPGWMARFGKFLTNVGNAVGITDRRTSGHAFARASVRPIDGVEPGEPKTAEPISRLGMLDTTSLFATRDLSTMAVRWCGDANSVGLRSNGTLIPQTTLVESGFGTFEVSDFILSYSDPQSGKQTDIVPDLITITGLAKESPELNYSLGWIPLSSVPRPETLQGKAELDSADKFEWGAWLLANESGKLGQAYNLIAFSLLAEAKDDIWLAAYELERASYCPDYVPPPPVPESAPSESISSETAGAGA